MPTRTPPTTSSSLHRPMLLPDPQTTEWFVKASLRKNSISIKAHKVEEEECILSQKPGDISQAAGLWAGLSSRDTLTCRSGTVVSPRPRNTPPAWFLSKILINRNLYFHTALAVWICKCLFNAPKKPSTLSEHMALYKGSWNADTASLSPS